MRRAFIMGSNGPDEADPLRYALQDAENMRKALSQSQCDFEVFSPELGSRSFAVYEQLSEILASCNEEDTFICYFSGHGVLEKGQLFLLWDNTQIDRLPFSTLSVVRIVEDLKHCKAQNKLLILDCCHAGAVGNLLGLKSAIETPVEEITIPPENYRILVASSRLEKARELEILQGSFLTANICSAICDKFYEADKDKDGKISIDDLEWWLGEKAKEHNKNFPKDNHVPYPHSFGLKKGDFFLTLDNTKPVFGGLNGGEIHPYQGLESFSKRTTQYFFGRKSVVDDLEKQLEIHSFVFLIGASGSGKSSVVQAGLSPILEEKGWKVLEPLIPWVEPVRDLKHTITQQLFQEADKIHRAYSLIDTDGLNSVVNQIPNSQKILLIVDQFEEVFTVCSQEDERTSFIKLLTQVASIPAQDSRLAIVATLRADFVESCLEYESLTRLIQNQSVWIPPLEKHDLEQVVTEPAKLQSYDFDLGLPEIIIQQIGQEKNFLPLLQFALKELWEQRDLKSRKLTLAQYVTLGGVLGALNRRAEEIYQSFDQPKQVWVKRIFLKLVRTGMDAKDTRQRQPKHKILEMTDNTAEDTRAVSIVLDKLVKARLLVTGHDVEGSAWVDLAHEALMDGWERFTDWRKENRELRRLIDKVEDAHREWLHYQKDEKYLMGRGLLAQIQEKWSELELQLGKETKAFCQISEAVEKNHTIPSSSLEKEQVSKSQIEEIQKYQIEAQKHQIEAQKYQLEAQKYQVESEAKDAQIEIYRKQNADLVDLTKLVAGKSTQILIESANKMADSPVYNFHSSVENVKIGGNIVETNTQNNNYAPEKSLAEAATEIQQLLDQLSKTNPTNTESDKQTFVIEAIQAELKRNPSLRERLISALKAGGDAALEELFRHPLLTIPVKAVRGWLEYDADSDNNSSGSVKDE